MNFSLTKVSHYLDSISKTRFVLLTLLLSILLSLFFFSPSFNRWDLSETQHFETARANDLLNQAKDPFRDDVSTSLRWRLFFPLIAKTLNLNPVVFLALAPLGSILLLLYCLNIFLHEKLSRTYALLATISLATCASHIISIAFLGIFISWYLLALLVIAFSNKRALIILAALLAPWISEMYIFGLPAAISLRLLRTKLPLKDAFTSERINLLLSGVSLFLYLGIRIFSTLSKGDAALDEHLSSHITNAFWYLPWAPLAWWMSYRASWLFIASCFYQFYKNYSLKGLLISGLVIFLPVVVLPFLASGMTSSILCILPVAVQGIIFSFNVFSKEQATRLILVLTILNLLIPMAVIDYGKVVLKSPFAIELFRWIY